MRYTLLLTLSHQIFFKLGKVTNIIKCDGDEETGKTRLTLKLMTDFQLETLGMECQPTPRQPVFCVIFMASTHQSIGVLLMLRPDPSSEWQPPRP